MSKKLRNWLWIIFGVCIVLFFLGIGAVIVTTAWVRQNFNVTASTRQGAEAKFESVRQQYAGKAPLLELRDGRPVYVNGAPPESTPASPLEQLNVLVWDPSDGELAEFSLPFWLLRMKSGPIEFNSYADGMDGGIDISPTDIEKHGPGVIIDTTASRGQRVLVWAQ